MTKNRWEDDPVAIDEANRVYSFLGRYVISFQWLEGQIDQILLLARGHQNWEETHKWLSKLKNFEKINAFRDLVQDDVSFCRVQIDGWYEHFKQVADRLDRERIRRNSILHAQFLFDFLVIGCPAMQVNVRRQGNNVEFTQENLSPARCEEILNELAKLAIDLNFICVQLRHVYRPS